MCSVVLCIFLEDLERASGIAAGAMAPVERAYGPLSLISGETLTKWQGRDLTGCRSEGFDLLNVGRRFGHPERRNYMHAMVGSIRCMDLGSVCERLVRGGYCALGVWGGVFREDGG